MHLTFLFQLLHTFIIFLLNIFIYTYLLIHLVHNRLALVLDNDWLLTSINTIRQAACRWQTHMNTVIRRGTAFIRWLLSASHDTQPPLIFLLYCNFIALPFFTCTVGGRHGCLQLSADKDNKRTHPKRSRIDQGHVHPLPKQLHTSLLHPSFCYSLTTEKIIGNLIP